MAAGLFPDSPGVQGRPDNWSTVAETGSRSDFISIAQRGPRRCPSAFVAPVTAALPPQIESERIIRHRGRAAVDSGPAHRAGEAANARSASLNCRRQTVFPQIARVEIAQASL
jgi:hypothetical protein